jgi:hypothetical protein
MDDALGMPEMVLDGHVAADEEVALLRLGPDAGPAQGHVVTILVDVARLEISGQLPAACRAHFLPGRLEIVRIDKGGAAPTDHLLRLVAEDRSTAGADLVEQPGAVGDQDQVERCLEDAMRHRVAACLRRNSGARAAAAVPHRDETHRQQTERKAHGGARQAVVVRAPQRPDARHQGDGERDADRRIKPVGRSPRRNRCRLPRLQGGDPSAKASDAPTNP